MSRQARILLLCDDRRGHANTVLDHIDAFRQYSRHQVRNFNPKAMRRSVALDLEEFDVVVIHYSVVLSDPIFVSSDFRDKLRRYGGLKIEFIQDDYRWVNRAAATARDVGVSVLFTVAPEPAAGQLYDERLPGVRRVHTLTGYVPDNLVGRAIRPLAKRPIDVAYRSRDLAFWLGRLSREKAWIGEGFLERAASYGLRCDIAWKEHERIYGQAWIDFLSSCRATLGCESGASIADFDGSAELAVRGYLREHPGASYEDVHDAVLRPFEGNVVVNVVSPRVFEAASLGTAMIMFPGEYSGVVAPGAHYISLEKDFSNMEEVVAMLRDDDLLSTLTRRAYGDLIGSRSYSYEAFVSQFDQVIDEEAKVMRGPGRAPRWRTARIERTVRVPGVGVRLARAAQSVSRRVMGRDSSMGFDIEYESQVEKGLAAVRTILIEPDLRRLFRLGHRAGIPLDRLLREILELSLLRKLARERLTAARHFVLSAEFDPERGALCFVSMPTSDAEVARPESLDAIRRALHGGKLETIEWDHRAMGGKLQVDRPAMTVGIGFEGLENFSVLTRLGREHPPALERALEPVLRGVHTTTADLAGINSVG